MKIFKSDHIYRKIYSLEITQSIYKPDSFFVGSSLPRLFPIRVFPSSILPSSGLPPSLRSLGPPLGISPEAF